jgi:hypothetical protein
MQLFVGEIDYSVMEQRESKMHICATVVGLFVI